MRTLALALVMVTSVATARADSKAWTTARDHLPEVNAVFSVDLEAVAKTALWGKFLPKMMGNASVKMFTEVVKTSCKIDLVGSVTSAAVGFDGADAVGAYIAIPALGQ